MAPTTVLVTQVLVGTDNYISWSKAMLFTRSGKNKLGFINGDIPKPTGSLLTHWQCNNDIVTSWIFNSISKEIAGSLVYTGSTKVISEELKERFINQMDLRSINFVLNWLLLLKVHCRLKLILLKLKLSGKTSMILDLLMNVLVVSLNLYFLTWNLNMVRDDLLYGP